MLTKEQKWMNRLDRCLKDMPEGCELLVSLLCDDMSGVELMKKGGFSRSINAAGGDIFRANWEGEVIVRGRPVKNVIANSESF